MESDIDLMSMITIPTSKLSSGTQGLIFPFVLLLLDLLFYFVCMYVFVCVWREGERETTLNRSIVLCFVLLGPVYT